MTTEELRELVRDTVEETLTRLGMDRSNPTAMQRDFAALRQWRESMEAIRRKGMVTLVSVIVTGVCAALWIGVRALLAAKGVDAPKG